MRPPAHPRLRSGTAAAALLMAWAAWAAPAGGVAAGEYEIKAAMLFNLSKFVEWPASKMGEAQAPFVVGIWGPASLAADMENTVRDKNVAGKPVVVRRLNSMAGVEECHILFVARAERRRFTEEERAVLAKAAVLTAGETESFAGEGGVIGLVIKDNRVQMEVNLKAAQRGGITISSRVLRLAVLVQGAP